MGAHAVAGVGVRGGADDAHLVHEPGLARQVLADADAGDIGGHGPKLAAELGRRIGFEIVHVDMARPAAQPEEDDRGIARLSAALLGLGLETQMIGQGQARQSEKADAQKAAPRQAVTTMIIRSTNFQHRNPPFS